MPETVVINNPISARQLFQIAVAICDNDRGSEANDLLISNIAGLNEHICRCQRCTGYSLVEQSYPIIMNQNSLEDDDDDDSEEPEVVTQTWCRECAYGAHRWSNGYLHNNPEQRNPIPEYHATKVVVDPEIFKRNDILGIELETYQGNVRSAAKKLRKLRIQWNEGLKYERDGSLDREHGVEIATRPFTLQEIRSKEASPWHEICEWSRSNGGRAWDAPNSIGYGMHISLNGSALTRCHRAKIVRFINDNKRLCEKIAGREQQNMSAYRKSNKMAFEACETDKYQAAANRGSRIEIRIFRASLNWDRFVRNCEFVDAVRIYTELSGMSEAALSEKGFLIWLNRPENAKSYPLLVSLLLGKKVRGVKELQYAKADAE